MKRRHQRRRSVERMRQHQRIMQTVAHGCVVVCGFAMRSDILALSDIEDDRCPRCGTKCEPGFGLAGGGFGPYLFCDSCRCVVAKLDLDADAAQRGEAGGEHG